MVSDATDSNHPTTAFTSPPERALDPTLAGPSGVPDAAPDESRLPGYEILNELGRGGMGVVYLARQKGFNRLAAVKMVLSGAHSTPQELARFRVEAEAVARVQHPNVVQVYEIGEQDGRPWFSMEYVDGGSLDRRLAGKPLSARGAAKLAEVLADAVAAMHVAGIIHRDLKPGNILLREKPEGSSGDRSAATGSSNLVRPFHTAVPADEDFFPKISDFGLAKSADGDGGARTADGAILGSPNYMSPEQAAGKTGLAGPLSDVYSLGAVLYELLTGRPPFRSATVLETVRQVVSDDPIPPSKLHGGVPRDLETICLKCLSKDPSKRYDSAAALRDDLQRYLVGDPILARPGSIVERSLKAVRRRPGVAAAVAATILFTIAFLSIMWFDNRRLLVEKDAANKARDAAEAERIRADGRLDKAIEAIEKNLSLVASAEWAKPEFEKSRRQMLEDAVRFYESFLAQESDDPRVQREAARSLYRAGAAAVRLGDYRKAESLLGRSASIQEKLVQANPSEPQYEHDMAQTIAYLGHADFLQNRIEAGSKKYERSTSLMESLVEKHPDVPAYQSTLVEDYAILASYSSMTNPARAGRYAEKAASISKSLAAKPDASLQHRVQYVGSLMQAASQSLLSSRSTQARKSLQEAKTLLKEVERMPVETARTQEMLDQARMGAALVEGMLLAAERKPAEGVKVMGEGLSRLDAILATQPRRFDMRIQKLNALELNGRLLEMLNDDARSLAANQTLVAFIEQFARDEPQMKWLKVRALSPRSMVLVLNGRANRPAPYESQIEALLADTIAAPTPLAELVQYNAACAYAQASKSGEPAVRASRARRATDVLRQLNSKTSYFRTPSRVAEMKKDSDLDPIRNLPEFAELCRELEAAASRKP